MRTAKRLVLLAGGIVVFVLCGASVQAAVRIIRGGLVVRTSATVGEAADNAQNGDTIEIDAGLYAGTNGTAHWSASDLTVRAVGAGRAHMRADGAYRGGKGIWVVSGRNFTVESIEFSGARVPDENGAGIRAEGAGTITVRDCHFHDNEDGILGPDAGEIIVEYSIFEHNGLTDFGYNHNIYVGHAQRLIFRHNLTRNTEEGHTLKSRANENYILYNRIMEWESRGGVTQPDPNHPASRAIDLPNAGHAYLVGNLIQQGPDTGNPEIVGYGAEGASNPGRTFTFLHNTVVNESVSWDILQINGSTSSIVLNNIFVTPDDDPSRNRFAFRGVSVDTQVSNLRRASASGLLSDPALYNYRLIPGSTAVDRGVDAAAAFGRLDQTIHPGIGPLFHYRHIAQREDRPVVGSVDFGAYEGGAVSLPARPRRLRFR